MVGGLTALVALVLFITAHEAGHFFAAKAAGMKVTEFFLGFGPRLWSFKRGETEYGIKPIPAGAYVKVVGMSALEDVPPEDIGRTYREKSFPAKAFVVLSGVGANFLIAYLMFFGLSLAQGQVVIEDGEPVMLPAVRAVVAEIDGQPTAAALAGLQPDDEIISVDGQPTPDWDSLLAALSPRPDEEVVLVIERAGEQVTVDVALGSRVDEETGERIGFLGLAPQYAIEDVGVPTAAVKAGSDLVRGVRFTFESFSRLLRFDTIVDLAGGLAGDEVPDESRPVSLIGVVQIGAQADEFGWVNFMYLLALINVILGTLNAVPLYPLDGGHFAVAVYERITGRQADVRKLVPVAVAVVGVLSIIGLLAMLLDIVNPIEL